MKSLFFVVPALAVLIVCQNAVAQEWATPEALAAFGTAGDTVKGDSGASEPAKSSPIKKTKGKKTSRGKVTSTDNSRACTKEITTDCTTYRVITPVENPPVVEEAPQKPNKMLLIL
jgi:hypothetical protein